MPKISSKTMRVFIEQLSFKAIIGILPFERVKKQRVLVSISFEYIFDKNSKEFIDYSEVASLVKTVMKEKKFELIEDAIITLEKLLYKNFNLKNLKLIITKPNILKDCVVSVSN